MQPYSITNAAGVTTLTDKVQPRTPGELIPVTNRPRVKQRRRNKQPAGMGAQLQFMKGWPRR